MKKDDTRIVGLGAYILALLLLAVYAVFCFGCVYSDPSPVPPDPDVIDTDPVPEGTVDRATVESVPIGASEADVRAILGSPRVVTPIDGVTVFVYPLTKPVGATGLINLVDGRVTSVTFW